MADILGTIGSTLGTSLGWLGDIVNAFIQEGGAFRPLLAAVTMSIALGLVGFGIRTVKSLIWGF